jgi:bifunctional UDP-N-acetylglucosamine pyrophosphorylase/glucosamine-1-phosphate N-acetyltransferase
LSEIYKVKTKLADMTKTDEIIKIAEELSSNKTKNKKEYAVILSAGHGKRIKSSRSKMLHQIWGIPTVQRVYNACTAGLKNINTVIVVGIKAIDVMNIFGKKENNSFAYQAEQNGTGHAVQIALKKVDCADDGIVYVLPGDMGLINEETIKKFRKDFIKSKSDMMVLTGIFEGKYEENSYGRIIRVKEIDDYGKPSGSKKGKVILIMEYKDILALSDEVPFTVKYNGSKYSYTKKELIENNEFNSGVYAFKYKPLSELINKISSENAQNEIYITDLIDMFNRSGKSVAAVSPDEQYVVMGFNNKSVLKEMEAIARKKIYNKLKDIIEIDDPDDFFIHEEIVNKIIEMDKQNKLLDIYVGKGVHIGQGVKLNYNLHLAKNVSITGNVNFGNAVTIAPNVHLSCFPNQKLKVGNNVQILWGNIIKGNIVIGDNSRIESSVNMTGSDEFPLRIGKNVLIKGTSYIFGSTIEDNLYIEHSVIVKKKVKAVKNNKGEIQPVRYFIPNAEGYDSIVKI